MLYYLLRCHSTVLYNNCGLKIKVVVYLLIHLWSYSVENKSPLHNISDED